MMPATRRTSCIGSAYCAANRCQGDAFSASANVLVPYCARRASASADVRPTAGSTPSRLVASTGDSAYQAASDTATAEPVAGPLDEVIRSPPLRGLRGQIRLHAERFECTCGIARNQGPPSWHAGATHAERWRW